MNYELAKELKEAGFRQTGDGIYGGLPVVEPRCYYPTLSELIEACGEKCDGVYRGGEDGWYATDGEGASAGGSTPEEAVARLFLSLRRSNIG